VDALRRIHSAMAPGGLVLDMQPVRRRPPVEAAGIRLGSLDMRGWQPTVDAVAALVDETIAAGLFRQEGHSRYEVFDTFDNGRELLDTVSEWGGTQISRTVAARVERAAPPIVIREGILLRVLRVV
jgi:hypothetical protein